MFIFYNSLFLVAFKTNIIMKYNNNNSNNNNKGKLPNMTHNLISNAKVNTNLNQMQK